MSPTLTGLVPIPSLPEVPVPIIHRSFTMYQLMHEQLVRQRSQEVSRLGEGAHLLYDLRLRARSRVQGSRWVWRLWRSASSRKGEVRPIPIR